jgi:antirestriction protein ArdC
MSKATMDEKRTVLMRDVTQKVIDALEAGMAEGARWSPPWRNTGFLSASNVVTHKAYRGGNALVLGFAAAEAGVPNLWGTYRQFESIGAQVQKGSKGTMILTPKPFTKEDPETGKTKSGMWFGTAHVFHVGQVDGYTMPEAGEPLDPNERNADADEWDAALRSYVTVKTAPGRAFYSPTTDTISLPDYADFHTAAAYYATLSHEAVHMTGHESRHDRFTAGTSFGDPAYAFEELIADLGAAMMGEHFGLAPDEGIREDHVLYLGHWLKALKRDERALWEAASKASKATTFLLDLVPTATAPTEGEQALAA